MLREANELFPIENRKQNSNGFVRSHQIYLYLFERVGYYRFVDLFCLLQIWFEATEFD